LLASVGSDVNWVLNTDDAANGLQHAGCDDELMLDTEHVVAAPAGAGAERTRAARSPSPVAHAGTRHRWRRVV
jgi:hypothetical protein